MHQWELQSLLECIVAAMTLGVIVVCDTSVGFVIHLDALLTSTPMIWHEGHIWKSSTVYTKDDTFLVLLCVSNFLRCQLQK